MKNNNKRTSDELCFNWVWISMISKNISLHVSPQCFISLIIIKNIISNLTLSPGNSNIFNDGIISQLATIVNINGVFTLKFISDNKNHISYINFELPKARIKEITSDPYGITLVGRTGYSYKDYNSSIAIYIFYNKLNIKYAHMGIYQGFYSLKGKFQTPKIKIEILTGFLTNLSPINKNMQITSSNGSIFQINLSFKKEIKKKIFNIGLSTQINSTGINSNGIITILPILSFNF